MKLIVLGSGGSEGIPVPYCNCKVCRSGDQRLRTSYLIKAKNLDFLVEIGPDFRQQQLKHNFSIDYLFISHAHDDHVRGLIELKHILLVAKIRMKRIRMIISRKLHKRLLSDSGSILRKADENAIEKEGIRYAYRNLLKKGRLETHILKYYRKCHFRDFSILLFKNRHGRTFSDGFLLEAENKKVVYLGDVSVIGEKTRELIHKENPDLLIANVPYLSVPKKKKDHMGIETLKELETKKILISHFSHRAGLTHKEIRREISKYRNITAAYDGIELEV
jgi:phosphoribosyl 1,2-cyclic phosphate phosphodiesterase